MEFTNSIDGLSRKVSVCLLRLTLTITASYLFLAEAGFSSPPPLLGLLLAAALASNVAMFRLPERIFESSWLPVVTILFDTSWITLALYSVDRFEADFFYVYFFILFLAAVGENLRVIALGAIVVSVGYLAAVSASDSATSIWTPSLLLRLPLFFSVAAFYGYLVQRVRRERQRRREEALINVEMEEAQERLAERARQLEEASLRLEREVAVRKEAEEELERSNRRLVKLSRLKSDFISTVSHELRTPLASIKNAGDLLASGRTGELNETQSRFVAMVARNIDRLTRIINDLLDLSKIEAGKMEMHFVEVDLEELCDDLVQSLRGQAEEKGLGLSLDSDPDLPRVWADPQRIEQVVSNLVSNAIKFTPKEGQVTIELRDDQLESVEVAVKDTGIGLTPEQQSLIFDRFYQVEDPMTRDTRGSGLGLAIVQRLLLSHGTQVAVASAVGEGSRFSFHLPSYSQQTLEMARLEDELREHRKQLISFSIFAVCPHWKEPPGENGPSDEVALARVRDVVQRLLPRSRDRILSQPVFGRLILLLDATSSTGAEVVRERLLKGLAEAAADEAVPECELLGPAHYPRDGSSAMEMVAKVTQAA